MSMWLGLKGTSNRATGTNGTVTLPQGAYVLQIHAFASSASTVQIFDDPAVVTLPASSGWWGIQFNHALLVATQGRTDIVFTSTSAYLIEYVTPTK